MTEILIYLLPIFILLSGIVFLLVGKVKKNRLFNGIGIGIIASLLILELPSFIEGFVKGFSEL
ncbi:hypothetical protein [Metabacillus malikii]|uniref:Uncharacterized protein n=1 Tax=Metabacillus malikii TaxID=1504265 RepID=A0ABT9ZIR1_9BACI|nr:hypothetical protein [Metabacillus malikii]MDQ0232165.1 hypothetical protein [Metabacillus malikii]